ncbi:hypothetical protein BDV29DRAFT_185808 [Aspergillus leporis]|jgi:hypothetical protein|uniref:Uncharacterized protein n=1 Tax=Aspergillus leporis TaxID=41062 RepID=A0A5N5WHG8_9EURO|nr:hypothetical protein BDV29DRAFT_185808 [Aspergillus leporis]
MDDSNKRKSNRCIQFFPLAKQPHFLPFDSIFFFPLVLGIGLLLGTRRAVRGTITARLSNNHKRPSLETPTTRSGGTYKP